MHRDFVCDSENLDETFKVIEDDLKEIASDRNISIIKTIVDFKKDLENLHNNNYKKRLKGIDITEITERIRLELIAYLNNLLKEYNKIEKKTRQKEKKQSKVDEIWKEINQTVEKESEKGNKTNAEIWIAVRDKYLSATPEKIQTKKDIIEKVMQLLDDEIYYQDVKYYTEDFKFLRDFPEVVLGSSPRRGFHDTKALLKYTDLREKLQTSLDEYRKIGSLLDSETDDATRRILESRKIAYEKQVEKRKREGREI